MKVIISHDVDHLTFSEHWRDAFVPKYVVRGILEAAVGSSTFRAFGRRMRRLAANRAHNLEKLIAFDLQNGVPATFFLATGRGRDLAYSASHAKSWLRRIVCSGFEVGVHTIAFDRLHRVEDERKRFEDLAGAAPLGARLHNVGMVQNAERLTSTFGGLFAQAGYSHTSNTYGIRDPYRLGGLWELPILLADGYVFRDRSRIINRTLEQAQTFTLGRLDEAERAGITYVSVLFHDVYFDSAFAPLDDWYRWLVGELHRRGWSFCSCQDAVAELQVGVANTCRPSLTEMPMVGGA